MDKKESPPAGAALDHYEVTSIGYDFAAIASEREVKLYAELGNCLSDVEPISQPRWQAIAAVVCAERDAGVAILRFAAGTTPWSTVKTAVRTVDNCLCKLVDVAPYSLALNSQRMIAADMAELLEFSGLPASTFYRFARSK